MNFKRFLIKKKEKEKKKRARVGRVVYYHCSIINEFGLLDANQPMTVCRLFNEVGYNT